MGQLFSIKSKFGRESSDVSSILKPSAKDLADRKNHVDYDSNFPPRFFFFL
jgi:hypothetical protein